MYRRPGRLGRAVLFARALLDRCAPGTGEPGLSTSGALHGGVAFAVGYVLTFVFEAHWILDPSEPLVVDPWEHYSSRGPEVVVGSEGVVPPVYSFVAWQFHSLHGASVTVDGRSVVLPLDQPALGLLPPLLLCLAGFLLVTSRGADDGVVAANRGATIALGYLPLACASALLSRWHDPSVGEPIGVAVISAAVITGLLFPLVFGSIGGYVGYLRTADGVPVPGRWGCLACGATAFLVWRAVPSLSIAPPAAVAGSLLVLWTGARDGRVAAGRGALIAAGFLPLVLLTTVTGSWHASDGTLAADPIGTTLLIGLFAPITLGAVGGLVAYGAPGVYRRTLGADRPGGVFVPALLTGATVFAVGFVATYLLEGGRTTDPDGPLASGHFWGSDLVEQFELGPDGELPGALEFATWQFHGLHGVGFRARGAVMDPGLPDPHPLLVLLPPLLLGVGGYVVVARFGAPSTGRAAKRGAAIAAGYLPLAVFTAVSTDWTSDEVLRPIGVSAFDALLLTGIIFPVTFGAIGGVLAYGLSPSGDESAGDPDPVRGTGEETD